LASFSVFLISPDTCKTLLFRKCARGDSLSKRNAVMASVSAFWISPIANQVSPRLPLCQNSCRLKVNTPPAKSRIDRPYGRLPSLYDGEVIIWLWWFLILDVFFPDIISNIPTSYRPVTPCPKMLSLIPLSQLLVLRQHPVGTLTLQVLDRSGY